MLNVEKLCVSIKGFPILRGVTLDIPEGGLIGLVGRNGAGKTTTLKGILGLVPVTGGRIALDGRDLVQVPAHKRAPLGIGYMPEDRRLSITSQCTGPGLALLAPAGDRGVRRSMRCPDPIKRR